MTGGGGGFVTAAPGSKLEAISFDELLVPRVVFIISFGKRYSRVLFTARIAAASRGFLAIARH